MEFAYIQRPTTAMTGQEALLLLLIADGITDNPTFSSYVTHRTYTVIGASMTTDQYDPTSPADVMLDIMIDTAYKNN